MEKNRVFGGKCYESLASYDRESSSWRTSQLCLFEEDAKSLDRLPKSGIAQNGQLFPLETSELRILDEDGLLLPTPTASDPDKQSTGGLHRLIVKGAKYSAGDHRNLPTPTAGGAANGPHTPAEWRRYDKAPTNIGVHVAKKMGLTQKTIGKDMRLSPLFVEWMMGFPIGWTDLER